ncbi:helix-turn-helix domain-containing protein [Streptomyces tubercidicus]|uniref:DNA-binding protein n=1 Tax=Streptomyces tubercidicus TaxID=47759 RepID=A0A640UUR8_9ACTN|nr:helix-turn-helix domain-containing protein [Streptomyces tubercidicus]WAU12937.1 helix-turn-helix domain-containing protein [Streptomyces tubercidicus]GFE38461.1 DNA-binding protein [Streptomyces tubercidicus]
MAEQQLNAPARAQYEIRRSPRTNPSGVHQVTEFQDPGYTIVGNHLTQHRSLSGLAIGLGAYIQSLPEGAPVDIRTLAKRFPEGRERIAAALRELETHGYLERVRRRTDDGRLVTLTISYNNPAATRARRARETAAETKRRTAVEPPRPSPDPAPTATPAPKPPHVRTSSRPVRAEAPRVRAEAPHVRAEPAPPPPGPQPHTSAHHAPAAALLANLRRDDPRLLLSVRDIHRLTPPVAAWLARGASPEAVRSALTTGLPPTLRHPAALLAHRLTELLPPPLPTPQPSATSAPPPLQTCDGCDRAFRAPAPGRCRDCRHPATERGAA